MVPRLTSLISLLAWRDQWRFLELTKAHVANGKKMAEIMYSSHNNWVLKVSGLALVLLYFLLWLVHCAFKHFITIFINNFQLSVESIQDCFGFALVLLWFCFIFLCDWSKKTCTTFSNNQIQNYNQSWLGLLHFPCILGSFIVFNLSSKRSFLIECYDYFHDTQFTNTLIKESFFNKQFQHQESG